MKLKIKPKRVFKSLLIIIFCLFILNCIGIYFTAQYGTKYNDIIKFFDFDTEFNFPTYFSSFNLLFGAVILLLISNYDKNEKLTKKLWFLLSLIFLGLSMDEFMGIHERISEMIRTYFNTSGVFYYAWVIPYGIFALVIGLLFYVYVLRKLPARIRNLLILSGVVFLSGAVGMEMISSVLRVSHNEFDLTTALLYTVEETLEMVGISLFIYGLLSYIKIDLILGLKVQN